MWPTLYVSLSLFSRIAHHYNHFCCCFFQINHYDRKWSTSYSPRKDCVISVNCSVTLITLVFYVSSVVPAPAVSAAAPVCVPQPALRGADLKCLLAPRQPEVWPSILLILSTWRLTRYRCCTTSPTLSKQLHVRVIDVYRTRYQMQRWHLFNPMIFACLAHMPQKVF